MTNIVNVINKSNTVNVVRKQDIVDVRGQGTRGLRGISFLSGYGIPNNFLGLDGDTYLDTESGYLYIKSSGSWSETNRIISVSLFSFQYEQQSPARGGLVYDYPPYGTSGDGGWVINHNLGFKPSVTVMDYGKNNIECDIEHVNENQLRLRFSDLISGYAYLS